jgi:hypothetical protein
MRTTPRRRRQISQARLRWIRPFFRHSYTRDAFVLRGVGRHVGPVFQVSHRAPRSRPSAVSPAAPASGADCKRDVPDARKTSPAGDRRS